MTADIDYDLAAAVGEVSETYDFILHVARLGPEKMLEAIERRYPAFVEHFEAMEEPPESAYGVWTGFGSWSINTLRFKYRGQWEGILDAYFTSCLHEANVQRTAMWSDVTAILKEAEF